MKLTQIGNSHIYYRANAGGNGRVFVNKNTGGELEIGLYAAGEALELLRWAFREDIGNAKFTEVK